MSSLPRVSVCGLGSMGIGFSRNLIEKGFVVSGYDVVPRLVHRLVETGGKATSSPKEAAENAEVLVIIVINQFQVSSVLFAEGTGAVHGLPKNSAIVISSTVPGAYCQEVRRRLDIEFNRPDVLLLDCPVSGGASGAASGKLTVFACGTDDGFKLASPVLDAIGSKICRIQTADGRPGPTGSGANGKVAHQVIPEIAIALVAEVFALAARAGLNTRTVYDHLQGGEGASWIAGDRIPHALAGEDGTAIVHSAMTNSQKDSSIIVRAAGERSVPVPLVAAAEQVYQTAVCLGWAAMDDAALWRLYAPHSSHGSGSSSSQLVHEQTRVAADASRGGCITLQDIEDIMAGVHLAATAESRAFTDAVGLHRGQMFDIVCGAAGWNRQFERYAPRMRKGPYYLQEIDGARQYGVKLVSLLIDSQHEQPVVSRSSFWLTHTLLSLCVS